MQDGNLSVDLNKVVRKQQERIGELSTENAMLSVAVADLMEEVATLREQIGRAPDTDFARKLLEQKEREASNGEGSLPEGAVASAG